MVDEARGCVSKENELTLHRTFVKILAALCARRMRIALGAGHSAMGEHDQCPSNVWSNCPTTQLRRGSSIRSL